MSTNAFVAQASLWRGSGGSPQTFSQICQTFNISGLGETNTLVDVTTFCSGGNMEYISGLSDGTQVTLDLNLETKDSQAIWDMVADVKAKATRSFEWRVQGDPTQPGVVVRTFHLDLVCLGWELKPSTTAKNTITFTGKVTGPIDITSP